MFKPLSILLTAGLLLSAPVHADRNGAVLGSLIGATAGSAIGYDSNGRDGAIVGAVIGGALGAAIGGKGHGYVENGHRYPSRYSNVYHYRCPYVREVVYYEPVTVYRPPVTVYVKPGRGQHWRNDRYYGHRHEGWSRDDESRDGGGRYEGRDEGRQHGGWGRD